MSERIEHEIRLSEATSPFGPGAVVDLLGNSFVAGDAAEWTRPNVVSFDRLLTHLGRGELVEPRTDDREWSKSVWQRSSSTRTVAGVQFHRFPEWRYCDRCSSMTRLTPVDRGKFSDLCSGCGGSLVPMRFVSVCKGGSHIQDIPWEKWVHRGNEVVNEGTGDCDGALGLKLRRSSHSGESLRSLSVLCKSCGRSRHLGNLMSTGSLDRDGFRCLGRQPWERYDEENRCTHQLVAGTRGATSNYFADTISALQIPVIAEATDSVVEQVRAHSLFSSLDPENTRFSQLAEMIREDTGASIELILREAGAALPTVSALADLKRGEWNAFQRELHETPDSPDPDFVVEGVVEYSPEVAILDLSRLITGIGKVHRVREVRALRGFRRYDLNADVIPPSRPSQGQVPRFPAVESYGEGLFLQIDESALGSWETNVEVQARVRSLQRRREGNEYAARLAYPSARYVMLHTLAHLLIRRLAFESGYPAASIKERIFASDENGQRMAGILIYATAGDNQGTLGGLVRLGAPARLFNTVLAALDEGEVCSNDPVCLESLSRGAGGLNLSACHGCALLSETSCESGNRLLDRQLLLGRDSITGFFVEALDEVRRRGRLA